MNSSSTPASAIASGNSNPNGQQVNGLQVVFYQLQLIRSLVLKQAEYGFITGPPPELESAARFLLRGLQPMYKSNPDAKFDKHLKTLKLISNKFGIVSYMPSEDHLALPHNSQFREYYVSTSKHTGYVIALTLQTIAEICQQRNRSTFPFYFVRFVFALHHLSKPTYSPEAFTKPDPYELIQILDAFFNECDQLKGDDWKAANMFKVWIKISDQIITTVQQVSVAIEMSQGEKKFKDAWLSVLRLLRGHYQDTWDINGPSDQVDHSQQMENQTAEGSNDQDVIPLLTEPLLPNTPISSVPKFDANKAQFDFSPFIEDDYL